jgi:hypothetical protein
MATMQMNHSFTFVNSSIATPPQDPTRRAHVRKQAIKQAFAARKHEGSQKKYNVRQAPVFIRDNALAPFTSGVDIAVRDGDLYMTDKPAGLDRDDNDTAIIERLSLILHESKQTISPNPSLKGYERLTLKYGFNILDLSDLATFHVGRSTRSVLSLDPSQVFSLQQFKPWSFLSFLPSSYEHSLCIKYAADCVAARVRQILSPEEIGHSTVIALYVKALITLQQALNCTKRSTKPEVLFATEIMAIYEVCKSL